MPFTGNLKGELTASCNLQILTGWVYAVIRPPHGFPEPYKDMTIISFYGKGRPTAYLMFWDEQDLERFPALIQYAGNNRVKIEVEGCLHTLTKIGSTRNGKLAGVKYPARQYLNPYVFDVSQAVVIKQEMK
jgi:hypothetical protein